MLLQAIAWFAPMFVSVGVIVMLIDMAKKHGGD
jgi:hypothetical protein